MLEASLAKVDELIHIGRRMRTIGLQSAIGGMALSMIGMAIAAAGYLPPVAGAIAQEVIDVLAVLNALRVTLSMETLRDDGIWRPHDHKCLSEKDQGLPRKNARMRARKSRFRSREQLERFEESFR